MNSDVKPGDRVAWNGVSGEVHGEVFATDSGTLAVRTQGGMALRLDDFLESPSFHRVEGGKR